MSSDLDWLYDSLTNHEDLIVPLKEIWNKRRGSPKKQDFDRFVDRVLNDSRFELLYSVDHDPGFEAFGLFAGPRVKLRSRDMTPGAVLSLARKHNDRIVNVLLRALEILRDNHCDTKTDRELQEALVIIESLRPVFKPWTGLSPDSD